MSLKIRRSDNSLVTYQIDDDLAGKDLCHVMADRHRREPEGHVLTYPSPGTHGET